jgi:type IV pilus assembly protein PilF
MVKNILVGLKIPPLFLWTALASVLLVAMLGCSSSSEQRAGVGEGKADLVTDSDEPESRSRARRYLTLAVLYFNDGKTTIALDSLKQAIAADPNWFEAYSLRGLIYTRLNNIPLAEDSFKRALSLNPNAAAVQHNYGRMLCKHSRSKDGLELFARALANPEYGERAKTLMAKGECQLEAGLPTEAEASFLRSYELDSSNPFTGYNLALLMFKRGELQRAQFYVRRLNNSESANAESLWLGIKVDRALGNQDAVTQLGLQLQKRFPQSREALAFERRAFNE